MAKKFVNIGLVYHYLGKYEDALKNFKQAGVFALEQKLVEAQNDNIRQNSDLAVVSYIEGEFEKTVEYFKKANLLTIEQDLKEYHIDITKKGIMAIPTESIRNKNAYKNFGNIKKMDLDSLLYTMSGLVNYSRGNYEYALDYFQCAKEKKLEVLGEALLDVANAETNRGLVFYKQGKYDAALNRCKKGKDIHDLALYFSIAESDLDTAQLCNLLGNIYLSKENYKEAQQYYEESLQIRQKILGENHLLVADSYNNIGAMHNYQEKYEISLEYYNKALQIRKKILGDNALPVADSYYNIAAMYYEQEKYEISLEYHNKVLQIRKKILGDNALPVADSYYNIAEMYYKQEKYEISLEYSNKVLQIQQKILGENHKETGLSYYNIGVLFYLRMKLKHKDGESQKYLCEQAHIYLSKAVKIYTENLGKNHPTTMDAQDALDECLALFPMENQ